MFIQPMVEAPSGQRVKLDVALGNWFAVIGYGSDPLACADAAGRALVERLGARAVKIVESRAGDARRGSARPGLRVIEDADNELRGWFAARSSDVVVLRPDRYPAALTTSRDLSQALAGLGSHPALERVHPHDDQSLNGPRQAHGQPLARPPRRTAIRRLARRAQNHRNLPSRACPGEAAYRVGELPASLTGRFCLPAAC